MNAFTSPDAWWRDWLVGSAGFVGLVLLVAGVGIAVTSSNGSGGKLEDDEPTRSRAVGPWSERRAARSMRSTFAARAFEGGLPEETDDSATTSSACSVTWAVTVPCSGPCLGGVQVQTAAAVVEPTGDEPPCSVSVGDTRTVSCGGDTPSQPCTCDASGFTQTAVGGGAYNPFFDPDTAFPCGACDGVPSGSPCWIGCLPDAPGGRSGDASITCINGQWALPEARPTCAAAPVTCPPVHESSVLVWAPGGVCVGALDGQECRVACAPGAIPIAGSTGYAWCDNGYWSAPLGCAMVAEVPPAQN